MDNKEFLIFWMIYFLVIVLKDIVMLLFDVNLFIIVLTSIAFGIVYWVIIFKTQ